jgi:hypothetical protein
MNKIGFFEEQPEQKSSTRLYSFFLLLFFMAFNAMALRSGQTVDLAFNFMLLLGVFAPKYLHKVQEVKTLVGQGTTKPTEPAKDNKPDTQPVTRNS